MSEAKHSVSVSRGENDEYRDARNALLEDEIKLRRDIAGVAGAQIFFRRENSSQRDPSQAQRVRDHRD